jgi:hypothetical protein
MRTLLVVSALALLPLCGLAQRDTLRAQLFAPASIRSFADTLTSTPRNMSDLLAARQALVDFFSATEDIRRDPRPFLEDRLRGRFSNRTEARRAVFEDETELHVVGVTGVEQKQGVVTVRFYTVLTAEGAITAAESSADLRKINGSWRIAAIGDLK